MTKRLASRVLRQSLEKPEIPESIDKVISSKVITQKDVVEILSSLVACPSVNPKHKVPAGPPFGEERLVRLLDDLLSGWGAKTRIQEVSEGRHNLIATFEGNDPTRSILLEAHADTVQVDDMTIPPFEPHVQDGKLYGRGSCDAKGPMASILLGIKEVIEQDGKPPITIHFVATCDEELGAGGAHALMKDGFRADFAIVGEPTNLLIINAHKGAIRWKVTTKGVPAHSSTPSAGVNAIYHMQKVIQRIEDTVAANLLEKTHQLLGQPTISVGTIVGGTQVNIIPGSCEIEVDRRLLPTETQEEATEEIVKELELLKREIDNFDYRIEQTEWYPPLEEEKNSPVAQIVVNACQRVLGDARFATAPWAANTGVFKLHGIPCVLFGPGASAQAHTRDEFIVIDQVVKAAQVFADIIGNL